MECDLFPGHHRAEIISTKSNQLLMKNKIDPCNVVCWVTACKPSNNAGADRVPFGWSGCFDHLLQLITNTVLKHPKIEKVIDEVHQLINHFNSSSIASENLDALRRTSGKCPFCLIKDCVTR